MIYRVIQHICIFVLVFFVLFSVVVVPTWWRHTLWVQSLVSDSVSEFSEYDINWHNWNYTQPVSELQNELSTVVSKIIWVFPAGIQQEKDAYREIIYDIIYVVVNEPENHLELEQLVLAAFEIQTNLYAAARVFSENTIYAMRYTF